MKIQTDRAQLAEALTWVARVIGRRPTSAALGGVRLVAADDTLTASAFDYEVSHTARVEAEVSEPGEVLVPGLFLRDAVAGGRGKDVTLTLDGNLQVKSGRSSYVARTLALEDYPTLPDFPDEVGTVKADSLAYALSVVEAAADDGSPHDNLRGLRVEADTDGLLLVGTDGRRLHGYSLPWDGKPFGQTVPVKTLAAAVRGMRGTVALGAGGTLGLLGLDDGTRRVTSRAYAVEYADHRRALAHGANNVSNHVTVDADDLLGAVKRVGSVVADERPVLLAYADGELAVTTTDQESGEAADAVDAEGEGPAFSFAFNHRLLGDLLAAAPSGPVQLHYVAGADWTSRPLMVVDPEHEGRHLLLMSYRLNERP